ncbi:MAG TPA: APC family permease [Acidimicrobiia bacterium]|nr:APC family permease [Acidimicrobiia bacterium]
MDPNSDKNLDKADSLTLFGAVSLGTAVMIGAGIFAITGQAASLAGPWFPLAFLGAAIVVAFSAYTYVKLSNAFPSSGGIAMFLKEQYGLGAITGIFSMFMYVSMVVNESLVSRTFGSYLLQIIPLKPLSFWVPALGVTLLAIAFLVNITSNKVIQSTEGILAGVKILGLLIFAIAGIWLMSYSNLINKSNETSFTFSFEGFLAAVALCVLAYKGFTTITNSGGEIVEPKKNTGRAIIIAIGICFITYTLIALAVAGNLSLKKIISAQDFALAEAARPAFGNFGIWFTVIIAIVATSSGVIASVFAASRMLAMLTKMKEVPRKDIDMFDDLRTQTLIYTIAIAMLLTIFFDLRRIAALGAIFYLIMDIAIHWGLIHKLKGKVKFNKYIVWFAIILDSIILVAFIWVKTKSDIFIIYTSLIGIAVIVIAEILFMRSHTDSDGKMHMEMDN